MTEPTDLTVTPAYRSTMERLEKVKHVTGSGKEYWLAREIYPVLGYTWEGFDGVITRAMDACSGVGIVPDNHFRQTSTMVVLGSGARRNVVNYFLSRAACYLIGIEAGISCLKRAYGLARCTWRGLDHFKTYIWSAVVAHNLVLLARLKPA